MIPYPYDRWIFSAAAAVIGFAFSWAFTTTNFVPTHDGDLVALGAALVAAPLAALYAATSYTYSKDNPRFAVAAEKVPALATPAYRTCVFAFVAFVMTFGGVQRGFLDWWTIAFGSPDERVMHVSRYFSGGGRGGGCRGFDLREELLVWRRGLCTDVRPTNPPVFGTTITLHGQASPFGMLVERYALDPSA